MCLNDNREYCKERKEAFINVSLTVAACRCEESVYYKYIIYCICQRVQRAAKKRRVNGSGNSLQGGEEGENEFGRGTGE